MYIGQQWPLGMLPNTVTIKIYVEETLLKFINKMN